MEVRNVYSLRFIPASKHKDGTNNICSHRLVQKLRLLATLGKLNKVSWSLARRRCKKLQSWAWTKFHVSYMVLTTNQFFIQWCVWLKLNLLVTFPKLESFPVIFESPSKPTILATILENVSLKKLDSGQFSNLHDFQSKEPHSTAGSAGQFSIVCISVGFGSIISM